MTGPGFAVDRDAEVGLRETDVIVRRDLDGNLRVRRQAQRAGRLLNHHGGRLVDEARERMAPLLGAEAVPVDEIQRPVDGLVRDHHVLKDLLVADLEVGDCVRIRDAQVKVHARTLDRPDRADVAVGDDERLQSGVVGIRHLREEEVVLRHHRDAHMVVARDSRTRVHAIAPFALVRVGGRLVDAVRHRLDGLRAPAEGRLAGDADEER